MLRVLKIKEETKEAANILTVAIIYFQDDSRPVTSMMQLVATIINCK